MADSKFFIERAFSQLFSIIFGSLLIVLNESEKRRIFFILNDIILDVFFVTVKIAVVFRLIIGFNYPKFHKYILLKFTTVLRNRTARQSTPTPGRTAVIP